MTPTELRRFQRHKVSQLLLPRLPLRLPFQPQLLSQLLFHRPLPLSQHLSQTPLNLCWPYRMWQPCLTETLLCSALIVSTLTSTILPHLALFPINLNSLWTSSWARAHLQLTASKFMYASIPLISVLQSLSRASSRLHLVRKFWMLTELQCYASPRHALLLQVNPLNVLTSFQERVRLAIN